MAFYFTTGPNFVCTADRIHGDCSYNFLQIEWLSLTSSAELYYNLCPNYPYSYINVLSTYF